MATPSFAGGIFVSDLGSQAKTMCRRRTYQSRYVVLSAGVTASW